VAVCLTQANGVEYEPLTGGVSAKPATPPANSSSSRDPCACSSDGYSGSKFVGMTLTGCKQHGLDFGDNSFYCYAQAGTTCETATTSNAYPGAPHMWLANFGEQILPVDS
jgi:hypothetical protein